MGTGDFRVAAKSRALLLDPRPSARRSAVQWTTRAPTDRATRASSATRGTIGAAALAISGRTERSPITPRWHSWVTRAVCAGVMSPARSRGIAAHLPLAVLAKQRLVPAGGRLSGGTTHGMYDN